MSVSEIQAEPPPTARSGVPYGPPASFVPGSGGELDDEAVTLDFHEELGAREVDYEPTSLELLYEEAIGRGDGPWLDEGLTAGLAETARLASLATRPTEPPAARRRIVPPRPNRPPDEQPPASVPPLPPHAGRAAIAPDLLRGLSRSSETPRPLTELEAAETLEPITPSPPLPDERSLVPLALDRASASRAPAAKRGGQGRNSALVAGRFGVLAAAMLTGALAMAWLSGENRADAVQSDLGRLAAGLAGESSHAPSCSEPKWPGGRAGAECAASFGGAPSSLALAGVTGAGSASRERAEVATKPLGQAAAPSRSLAVGSGAGAEATEPSSLTSAPTGSGRAEEPATVTGESASSDPSTALPEPSPFDAASARAALGAAASTAASSCRGTEAGTHLVPVAVTFAPSGRATTALITGSIYKGTGVGGCIAQIMKATTVSPFAGGPVTVQRTVTLY